MAMCSLSRLRVPLCFTRMTRASSAIEPLARVRVLHGQSKVTISMLGEHDKPAQSARHNSLQRNDCMTVQALLRTPTAYHEHQCKAMCSAACRLFSLRNVVPTFAALCAQLCTPAHSAKLFMARNFQHFLWVSAWMPVLPFLLMSFHLQAH